MVNDVTKFHKHIWGVGMLEGVCVRAGFHTGF